MNDTIFSQILKVRDTGLVNMFDYIGVQRIAFENELYELVNFIEEDKRAYINFILHGHAKSS